MCIIYIFDKIIVKVHEKTKINTENVGINNKGDSMEKKRDLAHVDYESQRCQPMKNHAENVASLAKSNCEISELKDLAELAGILHDAGKLGKENQKDFEKILELGDQIHKIGLDHSTAGGRLVNELMGEENWKVSEFISLLVYFHHGLGDCINLQNGQSMKDRRLQKDIDYDFIKEEFLKIYDEETLKGYCDFAVESYDNMYKKIDSFFRRNGKNYGNPNFFMGMYFRMVLSLLLDADWTDTECFFQDIPLKKRISLDETQEIWKEAISNFESYLKNEVQNNSDHGNKLNVFRQEISDTCLNEAQKNHNLYRLTVPTGSGKTLSSFRFALHRAAKEKKHHIIYVAPFNSILEQNAEEIRSAIGNLDIVLEHHCNVVCEDGEEEKYRNLTETWDSPIIVTTAVQTLNTLFSSQKSCIRRMHTLANSVIIFDEVQAIPTKCRDLFNLAVNFLSRFCNTTVVLCSATQPTLASCEENNIFDCKEMVTEYKKYDEAFKRVMIKDMTSMKMKVEDLSEFILEEMKEQRSILTIVNTIDCARKLFENLKNAASEEYVLFHLSNNMCPQHKLDTLEKIRIALKNPALKVICVSTQVVEAGVNFSFGCVIRSKAGLDNVIQAAGRCNRHKESEKMGTVYIVQMDQDVESLKHLEEIKKAQEALQKVLDNFEKAPDYFENTLDSKEAIEGYYKSYNMQLNDNATKFPVGDIATTANLVDLLGSNSIGRNQHKRYHEEHCSREKIRLAQAFSTAGEQFEVIGNDYKINVVVPYDDEVATLLNEMEKDFLDLEERRKIFRKLQRFTVGISKKRKEDLGNAIYETNEGEILVLCDGYYNKEIGVVDEPEMQSIFI